MLGVFDISLGRETSLADQTMTGDEVRAAVRGQTLSGLGFHSQR